MLSGCFTPWTVVRLLSKQQRWGPSYLTAAESGPVVAAAEVASFIGDAVMHVLGEAVQHADRLLAQADIRVDLLQHPVDVDLRKAQTGSSSDPVLQFHCRWTC